MTDVKCPFCAIGKLSHRSEPETFSYKGFSITVDQPGMYCSHCDEAIITGDDLKATRQAIHDLHAKADGYLTSDQVKKIRIKLGMNQREAGQFFGGGVNAFSRYERGEARQSKAIDMFMRLLDSEPSLLSYFSEGEEGFVVEKPSRPHWVSVASIVSHKRESIMARKRIFL